MSRAHSVRGARLSRVRRGTDKIAWIIMSFIVGMLILSTLYVINRKGAETAYDTLESLQDCGNGLLSSGLAQGAVQRDGSYGKCSPTKDCGNLHPAAAEDDLGYYYQYVGAGWGCPEGEYCCIRMPAGSSPLRAQDIRNKMWEGLEEGKWYITNENGHPVELGDVKELNYEKEFIIAYVPRKEDDTCTATIDIMGVKLTETQENCFNQKPSKGVALHIFKGTISDLVKEDYQKNKGKNTVIKKITSRGDGMWRWPITITTNTGAHTEILVSGFTRTCLDGSPDCINKVPNGDQSTGLLRSSEYCSQYCSLKEGTAATCEEKVKCWNGGCNPWAPDAPIACDRAQVGKPFKFGYDCFTCSYVEPREDNGFECTSSKSACPTG